MLYLPTIFLQNIMKVQFKLYTIKDHLRQRIKCATNSKECPKYFIIIQNFTVNSENQSVQKISCLINIGGLVVIDLILTFSPLFQGERSSCLYFNGCYQFGLCLSSWPLGLSSYPSAPHFWMTCLCEHVSSSSDSIFIAPHRFTGQGNPLCNVILT